MSSARNAAFATRTITPSLALAALIASVAPAALVACAHTNGAGEEKRLSQLGDEIARVQGEHDRFDQRLTALEVGGAGGSGASGGTARPGAVGTPGDPGRTTVERVPGDRPPATSLATPIATPRDLRVIRLRPDEPDEVVRSGEAAGHDGAADDPNDESPRPTIRVRGGGGHAPQIEQTLPPEEPAPRPSSPRPSALDPEARSAYEAGYALVRARRFDAALEALAGFIVKWPDHPYVENAMFWRGESYFAKGEYARAAEQLEGVLARFPLGNKAPDALLKLAAAQEKLGNPQLAASYYGRLLREHPRSDAARRVPASYRSNVQESP